MLVDKSTLITVSELYGSYCTDTWDQRSPSDIITSVLHSLFFLSPFNLLLIRLVDSLPPIKLSSLIPSELCQTEYTHLSFNDINTPIEQPHHSDDRYLV